MNYFFNQKRPRCKKRISIKIDDIQINIKSIIHDISDALKDNENSVKSNYEQVENFTQSQKPLTEKALHIKEDVCNSQLFLQRNFKKCCKISLTFISELMEFLIEDKIYTISSPIKIYTEFIELKADTCAYLNSIHYDLRTDTLMQKPEILLPIKDRKLNLVSAKDKETTSGQINVVSESKNNNPGIQFILSSEKSSNWVQDNKSELILSTIELVLTKLAASIKHRDLLRELEKKNGNTIKPKLSYYNENRRDSLPTNIYENVEGLNAILTCLSTNLNLIGVNQNRSDRKIMEVLSNDGTRNIMYPSGNLAILYYQSTDYNLLQIFTDDNNQLVAQFSNTFGGSILWSENKYIRVTIDKSGCKIFSLYSELTRDMKWPSNNNNKLSHSINIRFNANVSFHCSGKESIFVKFESNEEKNKTIEIKLHNWLFKPCNLVPEKNCLLATNNSYLSQFATELLRTTTLKQSKKDDNQKIVEPKHNSNDKLNDLKSDIRSHFDNWINFIKNRVKFEGRLIQRRPSKSAIINRTRTTIESSEIVTLPIQRNISAPYRNFILEKSLLSSKYTPKRLLSGKLNHAIEPKDKILNRVICPLMIRSGLINKGSNELQSEGLSTESCLCNKAQMTEITDLELLDFLKTVNPNQLVIIGVINTEDDSLSSERSKEKFIEESLASLMSELYEEDVKKSTQKPCQTYQHKSYRLHLYDIKCSGRFLNSTQSLLLRQHNILPGMCLMFKKSKLLFADYIFNGYKSTKGDLFKQISLTQSMFESGFYLPNDFQLNFNNKSKQWIEETAYSKIKSYNCISTKAVQEQLSNI